MPSVPRIDTHRHFGGSLSPKFVWEAIRKTGAGHLADSLEDVQSSMTFGDREPRDFHRFLDKFRILDSIEWTEDLIDASVRDVCSCLRKDSIDYTWLRFSPNKYLPHLKWPANRVINFIYDSFESHYPGGVGLVLSLKYEGSRSAQRQCSALIDHADVASRCIGIDLVGDETYFDADFYGPLLKNWSLANKIVMAHAGERGPAGNVIDAVSKMYVTDVSHGISLAPVPMAELSEIGQKERLERYSWLKDRSIHFHLALTANYVTGVWPRDDWHPIVEFVRSGLMVTIGTDDPVQCCNSLDQEFLIASRLGLNGAELHALERTAMLRTEDRTPKRFCPSSLSSSG